MTDPPPSRLSPNDRIRKALSILRMGRLSLIDCIIKVLDPSELEFSVYRDRFYASSKLHALLDHVYSDHRGQAQFTSWMTPHAIEFVSHTVYREMDNVKAALYATIDTIHPQSLVTQDLNSIVANIVKEKAPVLGLVLSSAAQTDRAKEKNKVKSCSTVCTLFYVLAFALNVIILLKGMQCYRHAACCPALPSQHPLLSAIHTLFVGKRRLSTDH